MPGEGRRNLSITKFVSLGLTREFTGETFALVAPEGPYSPPHASGLILREEESVFMIAVSTTASMLLKGFLEAKGEVDSYRAKYPDQESLRTDIGLHPPGDTGSSDFRGVPQAGYRGFSCRCRREPKIESKQDR